MSPGKPYPLGATVGPDRVHFGLVSHNATRVWLGLYEEPESDWPEIEFELDPDLNRTGDVWHIEVEGLEAGALYLYRVDGPFAPRQGHRFNPDRSLVDPYARALTGGFRWDFTTALGYDPDSPRRDLSRRAERGAARLPKCIVVVDDFDWQGDRPLRRPLSDAVIYEAHVRGLSAHESSGVEHPGTYQGVVELIPYLTDLGVTSLELLPVHEFDRFENPNRNPTTGEPLTNFWGYSTIAYFAPKASYAVDGSAGGQVSEFKTMVRELHSAGIEVILDVVFNHTGEGNELGPTISFRGIDNSLYYMLADDRRFYRDFSGTGNTVNCNVPAVRTLILDCLHYWVVDMHVDGFRFDLGSILGRDENGHLLENAPLLDRIARDPILQDTQIIAEAWDAGGAYQVGAFPGRWAEWNDKFRDDVRRFWRGDPNSVAALATRFAGSSDLYREGGRKPFHSINYVTAHDGFTLRDLVSYNRKHNEANGEGNRDGHDGNLSFNHGAEGDSDDAAINRIRLRQMKNFMATLLLSLGTPMLLAGDEYGRTQRGNNNAYCQDNAISWNDYRLMDRFGELQRFCRRLIALRKAHPVFTRPEFYTGRDNTRNRRADISWFAADGGAVEWESASHRLAVWIDGTEAGLHGARIDHDFYIMFNGGREMAPFAVPEPPPGLRWILIVNTGAPPPHDFREAGTEVPLEEGDEVWLDSRSLVVIMTSRPEDLPHDPPVD